jgi:predicted GH43/DUF377 family glycosyl hydrolase
METNIKRVIGLSALFIVAAVWSGCGGESTAGDGGVDGVDGDDGQPPQGPCAGYPLRHEAVARIEARAGEAMAASGETAVSPQVSYDNNFYSGSLFDIDDIMNRREVALLMHSEADLAEFFGDTGFGTYIPEFDIDWGTETLLTALLWPGQFVYLYGLAGGALTVYAGHALPCEEYDEETVKLYYDGRVLFYKIPGPGVAAVSIVTLTEFYRFVDVIASGDCERNPQGPVLDRVGGSPTVLFESDRYHMWYEGYSAMTGGFLDTLSEDGIAWDPAGWDSAHICQFASSFPDRYGPSVIPAPAGGYWMYYLQADFNHEGRSLIARAESVDAVNWTNEIAALEKGEDGRWDDGGVFQPSVVARDGTYWMWYSGESKDSGIVGIGLASSSDGASWQRHASNPVLTPGPPGGFDDLGVTCPEVKVEGDRFLMWYTAATGGGDWRYPQTASIALAVSPDGFAWTKQNAPLLVPQEGYEFIGVTMPAALVENGGITLWYTGVNGSYEPSIGRVLCPVPP